MSASVMVLSCDAYSEYWNWFFALKNKYWKDCPYPTYLVTESKNCLHAKTININSPIWTQRFREALEQIPSDYVIVLLEDYFIRRSVNQSRIDEALKLMKSSRNIAVFNFEQNYREALTSGYEIKGWAKQKNNQVYLNSTQPSLWNKQILMDRLREDQDPWQWELTEIDSPYDHLINTGDLIIDNGYRYGQSFGVVKEEMSEECASFLLSEGLYCEIRITSNFFILVSRSL